MSLRPPSTSPSPSPGPGGHPNRQARASLGPGASLTVGTNLGPNPRGNPPLSPRPAGMRPTSELITSTSAYQNPEAEAIDQWFENLQNYEATLEEMAAASLDVNFKEELSAIEQWFRVLSEAERTAALYSLLQHSTQVQIRFFITVLQQMARADPMTALLSPAVGASMQSQMEAKLASLGLKSPGLPASPSARSFNRQSMADANFLSPDSAAVPPSPGGAGSSDAAATLAQQRARLKATNAAHRISAPGTLAADAARANVWSATSLSQVAERGPSPGPDTSSLLSPPPAGTRPKSTDFTGVAAQFRKGQNDTSIDEQLSPMVGGNWASMVNTPIAPMFAAAGGNNGNAGTDSNGQNLDAAALKLATWNMANASGGGPVVQLDDARKFRRTSTSKSGDTSRRVSDNEGPQQSAQQQPQRVNARAGPGQVQPGGPGGFLSPQQNQQPGWGQRSPALSNVSSGRFPGSDDGMGGFNGMGGMSPGMGMNMGMMNGFGMMGMPGFGAMNMENLQAQLLAAQLAQMNPGFAGMNQLAMMNAAAAGAGGGGARSTRSAAGASGRRSPKPPAKAGGAGGGGGEEDVDPAVLNDVPTWLRTLRLHKYTPNFEGMKWQDMVVMDEAALEAKGVAALGARRKMLKTFQAVREKMGIPEPEGSRPDTLNDE
ncbi:VTS1 RNA-binding family SAM domain protein [Ceratobasidium sp. AG-Ba]|nr:VTS1 RNA-binding family SAM domain protein [Ceratobasidium sp. AG-Ba]QRW06401.1 VTS1 RNA-binding family SAM domain protein [Ceratobasidium sp. AG-Ba]